MGGGDANRPAHGHPGHQPTVRERLLPPAGLPDALLRLIPVLAEPVEHLCEVRPAGVADSNSLGVGQIEAIDEFAVDVELELTRGAVADAHGARVPVAGEVLQTF